MQALDQASDDPHTDVEGVEERAAHAANEMGMQSAEIERLPFDLSALEQDGIFINVDARGFGMLDRRLDWQSLGITLPQRTDLAFRPPRCGLLPDRYRLPLLRPAAQAHTALHRYSYTFRLTETLFETPAYRWVPWRAFEAFQGEFERARSGLAEAKTAVLEQYDAVQADVVQTFLRLATDSARRLEATGHPVPAGFQETVVRGVLDAMPTRADLQEKLTLRYRVGVVLLGSEMVAEQRRASEERRQLEEVEAGSRLEQLRRDAQARLVQQEFWVEEERVRRRLQVEEEERRREAEVKEQLRHLKLEAAKERLQEAMSPMEEGLRQLHAAIYDSAAAIRTSLQKHQYLHGSSAKRARDLARWFRLMSWQSDEQLEGLLDDLERLATPRRARKTRDLGEIDGVLRDIVDLCYADARALAEPHRMGALEL